MISSVHKGKLAEELAVKYLTSNNYQVIMRNFRSRFGEIDIFCLDKVNNEYVCIEVKSLNSELNINIEETISIKKLRRISLTLKYLLYNYHIEDKPVRFDFIGIVKEIDTHRVVKIKHLKNVALL